MNLFLICLKIFFARLIDVSLGTFRTINTVKGKDLIAALIGIVEITVWFLVVKEALTIENNSYFIVFSYAMGFSVGTYIGGKISNTFIKSNIEVQVILSSKNSNIIDNIKSAGYGVTAIQIYGNPNIKYMLYIQTSNKNLNKLTKLIKKSDKKAFIVINETKHVENGYFSIAK